MQTVYHKKQHDKLLSAVAASQTTAGLFIRHQGHLLRHHCSALATKQAGAALTTTVQIRTNREVAFGNSVRLVGGAPELGDWDVASAPEMLWSEGHDWAVSLSLPLGSYDFKCVVVHSNGSAGEWEDGPNRSFEVTSDSRPALEVICPWGETGTTITASPEGTQTQGSTEVVDQPREEAAAGTANTASNGAPEELSNLGELFAGEQAASNDAESSRAQLEASHAADSAVPRDDRGADRSSLAPTSSTDAAATATIPQKEEAPVEGGSKEALPSTSSAVTEAAIPKPEATQSHTQASSSEPAAASAPSTQSPTEGQRQSGVPPWLLAGTGLVAVPIVLWSEYALKTTGCGLPPGPRGALGAAEGLSYLALAATAAWALLASFRSESTTPTQGWQTAAVTSIYGTIAAGLVVLGLQVKDYGYIPAALPDSRCHGTEASTSQVASSGSGASQVLVAPVLQDVQAVLSSSVEALGVVAIDAGTGLTQGVQDASKGVLEGLGTITGTVQEASTGFRGFLSFQQEQEQEVGSGAVDGLSSADVTAVVDALSGAGTRLKDFIVNGFNNLAHPPTAAGWLHAPPIHSRAVGHPPLAFLPLPHMTLAEALTSDAQLDSKACHSDPPQQQQQPQHPLPRWMSSGDMSFMAAATNAVTTANNVTNQLNTAVIELQASVDNVRTVIDDASLVAQSDTKLDMTTLPGAMSALETALNEAHAKTYHLDLHPLVGQLHAAAGRLRQSANGSAARVNPIAQRLDDAAGDLLQAAEAADSKQIEGMRSRLADQRAALQTLVESSEDPSAAEVQDVKDSVLPVVEAADGMAGQLEKAVKHLQDTGPVLGDVGNLEGEGAATVTKADQQ